MLIDTHAHLFWESFKADLDQVLQRVIAAGVTTIINVGVDVKLSKEALKQAEQIKDLTISSTIGIHPHEAFKYVENPDVSIHEDCKKLEEIYLINPQKIVAVGECGLDFLFDNNPDYNPSALSIDQIKDLRRQLFQSQINLAKKLNLPLIVHCRDDRSKNPENSQAWNEVLDMVKGLKGILHCYSGLSHNTRYIIHNTGFLVSFAGNLTYPKNEYLREAVRKIPLEKICLETDSPFLSPQSKRGMRNEPSSVLEIAELIAQIKGVSLEDVGIQTTNNIKKLLKLS